MFSGKYKNLTQYAVRKSKQTNKAYVLAYFPTQLTAVA